MADISAVVLTIGEETLPRAVASVRAQSLPMKEIITVSGITPFHRALNLGASQVATEYFIQVDSDMTLDPDCARMLAGCFQDGVGAVIGHLRDPLMGRVVGIKMFRAACFEEAGYPDTISPDTDFLDRIALQGWRRFYALRHSPDPGDRHTFGSHRPSYTPPYVFGKFSLEGQRYRYHRRRAAWWGLYCGIQRRAHPFANLALAAISRGLFIESQKDGLRPFDAGDPVLLFLEAFFARPGQSDLKDIANPGLGTEAAGIYRSWRELGARMRDGGPAAWLRLNDLLVRCMERNAWIAAAAMGQGLVAGEADRCAIDKELSVIEDLRAT